MKYSIIIPFHNEEENVEALIDELEGVLSSKSIEAEIIAVDDASSDKTLEKLKLMKNKYPNIKIISFEKRAGQSAALWAGIKNASTDIVITMDGDMQNDPSDIPKMISLMDKYDAVFGWRKKRNDPIGKRVSSKIGNAFRVLFTGKDIHDTGCGLKAMKKRFFEDVFPFNGIHRFFPAIFKIKGASFTEVEVNHRERKKGKTKYNALNRAFTAFYDLIGVRWIMKKHVNYRIKEIV